jgi:dihydrolipoamide dehydrogenase
MAKNKSVVVIGSGPSGYAAAFRASDLGLDVTLIERYKTLGGVCLNVGCIPSKALLHAAKVIQDSQDMQPHGISFGEPTIDIDRLRGWKEGVIQKLTGGLSLMAKQRKVTVIQGLAEFTGPNELKVTHEGQSEMIAFENAIIAVGSQPVKLPFIPVDSRIVDSTGALELQDVQGDLLVLGGGIIGMEMATVYHALGMNVSVVEMQAQLVPGADADVVKPLYKRMEKLLSKIYLETSVTAVEAKKEGLYVTFSGKNAPDKSVRYDKILVAVGRRPNGALIAADKAGVTVDARGFIPVDKYMRTNVAHIYAIGDVVGNPMLAHKGAHEGRLAAEILSGLPHENDHRCIPSVAYTDPEVAWVGLTENEAKEKGIVYKKGVFPWMASGRAISIDRTEGLTKLIIAENGRVLGAGIVGVGAGELIGEIALAIEMGADVEDVALTIHPHPSLSESVMLAAEICEGTITDLYMPKKKENES